MELKLSWCGWNEDEEKGPRLVYFDDRGYGGRVRRQQWRLVRMKSQPKGSCCAGSWPEFESELVTEDD